MGWRLRHRETFQNDTQEVAEPDPGDLSSVTVPFVVSCTPSQAKSPWPSPLDVPGALAEPFAALSHPPSHPSFEAETCYPESCFPDEVTQQVSGRIKIPEPVY